VHQGVVIKNTENVKEPQNNGNYDNGIQKRLYGTRHRDESIDNP
jgi:hypothetical protein